MSPEIGAAIIGAVLGGVLTGCASYFQQWWSRRQDRQDRVLENRLQLVREIMRYRLDQKALVNPLNEIPLLFGHDAEALRLCRAMQSAHSPDLTTQFLTDLVNHLAKLVGLPPQVRPSDIDTGFRYAGD